MTEPLKMNVIDESAIAGRSVQALASGMTARESKGEDALSFECGRCGHVIIQSVTYEQVMDLVFKCHCAALNEPVKPRHASL